VALKRHSVYDALVASFPYNGQSEWSNLKRKDFLPRLGFDPSSKRPIERFDPATWKVDNFLIFKKFFPHPHFRKLFLHLPKFTPAFFAFLACLDRRQFHPIVHFSLAIEISNQSSEWNPWDDVIRLEEIFRFCKEWRPKSLRELYEMEIKMVSILTNQSMTDEFVEYPHPPFPEEDWLYPIQNNRDLFWEGKKQHNCVYDYDNEVRQGRYYIYHVLGEPECTLSLVKIDMDWFYDQIAGPCNKQAPYPTLKRVEEWRTKHSILVYGDVFRMGLPPDWIFT